MKWLKRLLIAIVVLVVAVVAVAFFLPDKAHVERSIVVDRPSADVFAVLNDMRRFNDWSPWVGKDPNAKYTLSGPATGVGAKLAWEGDPSTVGTGSIEIAESVPPERIRMQLDFGPMGRPMAEFRLAPEGAGTRVTWSFDGTYPLALDGNIAWSVMSRWMALAFDSMLGPDYESGLAKLETVVEAQPAAAAPEPASTDPIDAPPADAAPAPESAAPPDPQT